MGRPETRDHSSKEKKRGRQALKDRAHNLIKPEDNPSVTVRRVDSIMYLKII